MSDVRAQVVAQPPMPLRSAAQSSVPRIFQSILVVYVLLTGQLVQGVQAVLFGLQGSGGAVFTVAILLAIIVDLARIAPLFVYARHPLGILHPLILTTVLWPLVIAMPGKIEDFFGLGGLLLGEPISPPFFTGIGWLPGPEIWRAVAWSNLCELLALLSIYVGYALARSRDLPVTRAPRAGERREFDGKRLRVLAVFLIAASVGVLMVLISLRGGLMLHLADMARGRFRSMAGLGPLVSAVDLGLVALTVWIAARPEDSRKPLFLILMIVVAAAEFISNGARSSAFAVFMMVALAWALRTRRIPWRVAFVLIPVFFLAFGALNLIRTAGFTGESAGQAIEGTSTSDILTRVQEEIDLRQSLQSTVPVIWEGHELMGGPLWGSSYGAAVFAFVPRWVWQDKPRGPGSLYAQNFLGEVREGLAVPVNPTAEEYWNFGLLGVILISAFYGALIRYAHHAYIVRPDNPFIICAFVLFVTTFHPSTDDLVLFQQQAVLLIAFLVLALLFAVRIRRPHYDPAPSPQRPALTRPPAVI